MCSLFQQYALVPWLQHPFSCLFSLLLSLLLLFFFFKKGDNKGKPGGESSQAGVREARAHSYLLGLLREGKEAVTGGREETAFSRREHVQKDMARKSRAMPEGGQSGHGQEKEGQCSWVTGALCQRVL